MSGLLFPKAPAKKKHRSHAKQSIIHPQRDRHRCLLCMWEGNYQEQTGLQKHHVFMGPLRFFTWLCPEHHTIGSKAVHRNHDACMKLQQYTQAKYEQTHTREEFMELTGRSYL